MRQPVSLSAEIVCGRCGRVAGATDVYCAACGNLLPLPAPPATNGDRSDVPPLVTPRRRLGGSPWHPPAVETDAPGAGISGSPPPAVTLPAATSTRRRRRRRRRAWYRRPLLMVPTALALVVLTVAGVVGYRAESTIATLHEVSTPPPVVADHTEGDEPLPTGVAIDTGPAIAAVQAAEAAKQQTPPAGAGDPTPTVGTGQPAPTVSGGAAAAPPTAPGGPPTPTAGAAAEGNGLLGRVKGAAKNVSDLAEGAAVAAGVKDPSSQALTLLVMGVDARVGAPIDIGVRPDALMVVRLDPAARSCRLLAIPRDTRADLPGYGQSKINHALMIGGIPYEELVVENLLGISLDGYALIDFVAFQKLVDAVGGVPVDVPQDVTLKDGTTIAAGRHTMNGAQALAFARYRDPATDGDIGRVKRQWAVLKALAEVEGGRDLVGDVNDLLPAVADHVRTNLAATDLAAIAKTYGGSCTADTVGTSVLAGTRVRMDDPILQQAVDYNVVDATLIRQRVAELLGGSAP
jgi:LCP family protein required for cell wall assembly